MPTTRILMLMFRAITLNYPLIVTLFKHFNIANDVFIVCFSFLSHADVLLAIPME